MILMSMPTPSPQQDVSSRFSTPDLGSLVREPREALDMEVQGWLDLSAGAHRASLAKEIIALTNHGVG